MITAVLPTYARADIAFVRGEGPYLFDGKGERYLDFGAGIAVNALGHAHPHLVAALREQAAKLWHTSNLYRIPEQERLAARLVEATFADTVFFANSGAEAVECALKIGRRFHYANNDTERWRFVTFEGAFHGRTLAMIAAGNQPKYLEGFGPRVDGFDTVPYGDFDAVVGATTPATAGILIEPIQGEMGVRMPPEGFLKRLRQFCTQKGILLILDEVQTGMGRTGRLFAHEWAGITPDIMAVAKGIGGGFPLSACLATEEAAKGMKAGSHGSTYGGNPLAMAVGNAVLDVMLAPTFLEHVRRISGQFQQQLGALRAEHPGVIAEIRGQGLLLGLKLYVPASDFLAGLLGNRMLAVGATENVIRLAPPLIVTETHLDEAVSALSLTCTDLEARKAG
ncbi:MAG: aspartate aminotransferase family protein [Alphaproteobacteria bacterium]